MKRLSLGILAILGCPCFAAPTATPPNPQFKPEIDQAFSQLYSSNFAAAQTTLDHYIAEHPNDSVAYSVKGAGYLFSELERLGILEADFFQDDRRISDKKKLKPDPQVRQEFYAAIGSAQSLSKNVLATNPNDTNALFGKTLALGSLTDYTALIEKKQFQSLSINKEGYRSAKKLLEISPEFYDAHLSTGFTEYIIGSIPVVFRWLVKFDDVQGDKNAGVRNLQLVAEKGHYLKPFAKILLATAFIRDKHPRDAQKILQELTQAYPQNAMLKRELDRISGAM